MIPNKHSLLHHQTEQAKRNPSNDAYTQLTELSDMLENQYVKQREILRIIDEVREKMRKDARHNAWMASEHRKKLIEAADRCKPIFDRGMAERETWQEKVRRDYAGILSIPQIEMTIGYWQGILDAELDRARKEALQEAIDLSDKIEMQHNHTTMDEWKAFKGFRNTLRDKIKEL